MAKGEEPKWISVNFQLPKKAGTYEVKFIQDSGNPGVNIAFYGPPEADVNNKGKTLPPSWNSHGTDLTAKVTHWRPWSP